MLSLQLNQKKTMDPPGLLQAMRSVKILLRKKNQYFVAVA